METKEAKQVLERIKIHVNQLKCKHTWEDVSVHGPLRGSSNRTYSVLLYKRCLKCDCFKRNH